MSEKPRKRNAEQTRLAIFNAACERFASDTYDNVNVRDIARDAGIDHALVIRYFGSKEELFKRVLRHLLSPAELIDGDRRTFGKRLAAQLTRGENEDIDLTPTLVVVHSAISNAARPGLISVLDECLLAPLAEWLGGKNADMRSHLIVALCGGAAMHRKTVPSSRWTPEMRAVYEQLLAKSIQLHIDEE